MLEMLKNVFRAHDPGLEALGITREYQEAAARQGLRFVYYAEDFVSLERLNMSGAVTIFRAADAAKAYEGWLAQESAAEAAKKPQARTYSFPFGPTTGGAP